LVFSRPDLNSFIADGYRCMLGRTKAELYTDDTSDYRLTVGLIKSSWNLVIVRCQLCTAPPRHRSV